MDFILNHKQPSFILLCCFVGVGWVLRNQFVKQKQTKKTISWQIRQLREEDGSLNGHSQGNTLNQLFDKNIKQVDWLLLPTNYCPQILHHIKTQQFAQLTRLELSNNLICSIQILPQIYMPKLQYLELNSNRITCVKPLRKIASQQITWLSLYNNPLLEIDTLTELFSEKWMFFWIQFFENDYPAKDDVRFLCKVQSKQMNRLHCNGIERIRQPKTFKKLKNKSIQLQIRHK